MNIRALIPATLLLLTAVVRAQTPTSPDELFKAARHASFEEKDYNKAKQLAKQALLQAPQYAEIEVFLGRLYTWNKQYDSAKYYFMRVLSYAPENKDANIAYTDLEYWNEHYGNSLVICNNGLSAHPASTELLLRKAKIYNALKQYKEAATITTELLQLNATNTEALALASSLKDAAAVNKIAISYDYSYFDRQFSQPWHLGSFSYSRNTKAGSISASVNYANRFGRNGWQGELDAYPRISKTFYSYVNFGFSPGESVFPKYRAGFSLYANLPQSIEAEAGLRYLNFGSSTFVYTLYAGKYYKNYLFGVRTYITPGSGGSSQSYIFTTRYYLKSADDYVGVSIGTGISPDDKTINVQYNNKARLTSKQASLAFNHGIGRLNIVSLKAGYLRQEYNKNQTGNQFNFAIGLQRRF